MKRRTREVLGLLADETTAQILEACAGRGRSEAELITVTRASRPTLSGRLQLLAAYGVMTAQVERRARGRPATRWTVLAGEALDDFSNAADDFVGSLLRAQLEEHETAG